MKKRLFWLSAWGIAFGMIEAAVVIYLREIYYPAEFHFPPLPFGDSLYRVELAREAATLLILWAAAELSAGEVSDKIRRIYDPLRGCGIYFIMCFLKIFLDWPESLLTWDILFLIPWVWAGPVLAPVLVSFGLIWAGIIILKSKEKNTLLKLPWKFWAAEVLCGALILTSFLIPRKRAHE